MKYLKLFLTVSLMASAMSLSAQYMPDSTVVTTTKTVDKGDYDKGYHLMPELKIGSCYGYVGFGANIVLEHEFHKYLAWDIASLDFSAPFDFSEGNFGLKTGVRAFTKRFWDGKARGYMSAAAGWDCNIRKHSELTEDKTRIKIRNKGFNGLGVSWGLGLQFQKHFFVGYTFEYSTAKKFTSHYAKVAYRF